MAKTVTKIPQTRNLFTTAPIATTARRKVAGYARVSTDSDEQFTSYEAQVDYYTNYIHMSCPLFKRLAHRNPQTHNQSYHEESYVFCYE